ncbi:hypothetical protein [Allostreptomyces psammosilenae]|uniref:Uncharacterized protein n=1 Tax=Allostreptomyces psammosilenae TaxID=1892865 RepID=A0A853A0A4_9ACTN|nr:hypothetical protein [Allostreptomyces psammosilenae]NYI07805.1 hypothetical protein [Allostreptomyces psammosilenae]
MNTIALLERMWDCDPPGLGGTFSVCRDGETTDRLRFLHRAPDRWRILRESKEEIFAAPWLYQRTPGGGWTAEDTGAPGIHHNGRLLAMVRPRNLAIWERREGRPAGDYRFAEEQGQQEDGVRLLRFVSRSDESAAMTAAVDASTGLILTMCYPGHVFQLTDLTFSVPAAYLFQPGAPFPESA